MLVWEGFGREREANPAARASYLEWRRDARSFESIAAFSQYESVFNLTGAGEPREIEVTHVTEDFFNVLGITAIAGRPILPADGGSQAPDCAIYSSRSRSRSRSSSSSAPRCRSRASGKCCRSILATRSRAGS